jgi:hypothetical protein
MVGINGNTMPETNLSSGPPFVLQATFCFSKAVKVLLEYPRRMLES